MYAKWGIMRLALDSRHMTLAWRRRVCFVIIALSVLTSFAVSEAKASDCDAVLRGQVQAALSAGDLNHAKTFFLDVTERCNPEYQKWVGNQIALRIYNAVSGTPSKAALEEALHYGSPWQAFAALGDIEVSTRDWAQADERYQQALAAIADPKGTPDSPGEAIILSLKRKAEQAGLLAQSYVGTLRGRDGENEGLAAANIRGVTIVSVALPVQFEFDSTELTEQGRTAAKDMADFVRNSNPPLSSITLIGHADPRGSDVGNMVLSNERAQALASFLRTNGVNIDIRTDGRGSNDPYQPDQPSKYTQEELWQMDRRVELVRH